MKHILKIMIISVIVVAFAACGGDSSTSDDDTKAQGATPSDGSSSTMAGCKLFPKTGQTQVYADFDDGYYQKGQEINPRFVRDDITQIVTDKATGLAWQDDEEAKSIKKNSVFAKVYCEELTLAGHVDWRVPHIEELINIIDKGERNPAINPAFHNTDIDEYWSSTEYKNVTSLQWLVSFSHDGSYRPFGSSNQSIRCVRGAEKTVKATLVRDDTLEVVKDTSHCLMWQDDNDSKKVQMPWREAVKYCEDKVFAGFSNWRLPNIHELSSLEDFSAFDPAISGTFKNIAYKGNTYYWSSTHTSDTTNNKHRAWAVDFSEGAGNVYNINRGTNIRCVREGK